MANQTLVEGDIITIDEAMEMSMAAKSPHQPKMSDDFQRLRLGRMKLRMKVRTNAETLTRLR